MIITRQLILILDLMEDVNTLLNNGAKMGGRYDSNPAEVQAGFVVYPEGEYTVEIGEPKGSEYMAAGEKKAGIRVPLRITDGEFKTKVMNYFGDELNEFGKKANKRLLMAAHGVHPINDATEASFNQTIGELGSFGFNTADGTVDAGWLTMKGKAVIVSVGVNAAKDGSGGQFQKFKDFRPVGTEAKAATT